MTNLPDDWSRNSDASLTSASGSEIVNGRRPRRLSSRLLILLRRVHLYAGLFLLPWVLLYGVTGAMFNHAGLFNVGETQVIGSGGTHASTFAEFPQGDELADAVVQALRQAAPDVAVTRQVDHPAEFTNELMFELRESGQRHVVQLNPLTGSASVTTQPDQDNSPQRLLSELHHVQLTPDPHRIARQAAAQVLQQAEVQTAQAPAPLGWTKLNFLADIDGQPARITYVLKDGHVDIFQYTGEPEAGLRNFLLRLHTSHGQSPHWNGRSLWSLLVDAMALAMVTWALTGLVMWWQIRRTRLWGTAVIVLSAVTATGLYLAMTDFYSTTLL